MSRIASLALLTIACLMLSAPCSAEESTIKSDAKKIGEVGREVGLEIGKGATKFGKAVASTAKEGAKAVSAGAKQVKRNLEEK